MPKRSRGKHHRWHMNQRNDIRSRQRWTSENAPTNAEQLNAMPEGKCTRGVPLATLWSECVNEPNHNCTDCAWLAVTARMAARMNKRQNWITEVKMTAEYRSVARQDGTSTPPLEEVWYLCKRPFEQRMKVWRNGIRQLYQDRETRSTRSTQMNIYEI